MRKIRTPFFEIGTKNYIYGDDVLKLAMAADEMAEKYDIDVLFTTPYADIRRVAENTKNLIIIAPYMDTIYPGRGMACVLPESLKAAGIIKKINDGVKVLGRGELTAKNITVQAAKFTKSAVEKIEAAGGKAEVI